LPDCSFQAVEKSIWSGRSSFGEPQVTLSDFCWAIAVIKEHLWEFLERQGFKGGPVEIYGEMELLRLLDRFLDHALCFATEGHEQHSQLQD